MKKLLFVLLAYTAGISSVQAQSGNYGHRTSQAVHSYSADDDDLPARNHGTGVRLGTSWALARATAQGHSAPVAFEAGVFHQRALSRAVSVQGEALYYRAATAAGRTTGFRLPLLLVINPFYNVSIHAGPQLQVRTGGTSERLPSVTEAEVPAATPAPAGARLTGGLVIGGEARIGFLRVGLRYGMQFKALMDLPAAGQQVGSAWQNSLMQAYLGAGF